MNDSPTPSLQKIRTFASDFAKARESHVVPEVATSEKSEEDGANPPFHFIQDASVPNAKVRKPAVTQITPRDFGGAKNLIDPQASLLTDTPDTYEITDDEFSGGTIVRETKGKRFRLFPEIKKSMSSWMQAKQDIEIQKIAEQPKVSAPENRTETILAAASLGVLPASDDHKKVVLRIAETPHREHTAGFSISSAKNVPEPSWLSTADAPQEATAEHESAIDQLEEAVTAKTVELPPVPILSADVTPQAPTIPEAAPEIPEKEFVAPVIQAPPYVPSAPVTSDAQKETEVIEEVDEPIQNIEIPEPVVPRAYAERPYQQKRIGLPVIAVGVLAIVLGVASSFALYAYIQRPTVTMAPEIISLIQSENEIPVALNPEKMTFLTNLNQAQIESGSDISIFYPTISTNDGMVIQASTNELLAVLNLSAPGQLQRSIDGITFGSIAAESPFMIISVDNFDVAFSGMLQWEKSIASDVSPFFGTLPITSFSDTVSSNRDIRVAKRSDGTEFMYTFLDRTTILITTARRALEEIVSRKR